MIKYACDVCESVNDISRLSFTVGKEMDAAGDISYVVNDLDICGADIKMLTMYFLNQMTRNENFSQQLEAYKYLQNIAKKNKQIKEELGK